MQLEELRVFRSQALTGENIDKRGKEKGHPQILQPKRAQTPHVRPLHPS